MKEHRICTNCAVNTTDSQTSSGAHDVWGPYPDLTVDELPHCQGVPLKTSRGDKNRQSMFYLGASALKVLQVKRVAKR